MTTTIHRLILLAKGAAAINKAEQAVIRAARWHSHAEVDYGSDPGWESSRCPICRAIARLDKLNTKGGPR